MTPLAWVRALRNWWASESGANHELREPRVLPRLSPTRPKVDQPDETHGEHVGCLQDWSRDV